MARVRLEEVTAENWEEVVELELEDDQEDFVASNAYSIAESKFNPYARPRAIYAGDSLVGFLMYEVETADGDPHDYNIYRFMIDAEHQGKGYGRAALKRCLQEIQDNDPKLELISICYVPHNPRAKEFYASLGFKEVGIDEDGEMVAEIEF